MCLKILTSNQNLYTRFVKNNEMGISKKLKQIAKIIKKFLIRKYDTNKG